MSVRAAYHGANVVGPWVIPVRSDGFTSLDCRGQLKSTRSSVIIAGESRVIRVGDRVAENDYSQDKWRKQILSTY